MVRTFSVWLTCCVFVQTQTNVGKFIMSASSDTTILVWDLKGEVLASINTNQMTNSYAAISPCGRYNTAHVWQMFVELQILQMTK